MMQIYHSASETLIRAILTVYLKPWCNCAVKEKIAEKWSYSLPQHLPWSHRTVESLRSEKKPVRPPSPCFILTKEVNVPIFLFTTTLLLRRVGQNQYWTQLSAGEQDLFDVQQMTDTSSQRGLFICLELLACASFWLLQVILKNVVCKNLKESSTAWWTRVAEKERFT